MKIFGITTLFVLLSTTIVSLNDMPVVEAIKSAVSLAESTSSSTGMEGELPAAASKTHEYIHRVLKGSKESKDSQSKSKSKSKSKSDDKSCKKRKISKDSKKGDKVEFCPTELPDPDPNVSYGTTEGPNAYAWANDFSDECGVGMIVASRGTVGTVANETSTPVITLRDGDGTIIFERFLVPEEFPLSTPNLGVRAGLVVGCQGGEYGAPDALQIVLAIIGDGIVFSQFLKLNIDFIMMPPVMSGLAIVLLPEVDGAVRNMRKRVDAPCEFIYGPDINAELVATGQGRNAVLRTVNFCDGNGVSAGDDLAIIKSFTVPPPPTPPNPFQVFCIVWELKCDPDEDRDICWIALLCGQSVDPLDPTLGLTLDPFLVSVDRSAFDATPIDAATPIPLTTTSDLGIPFDVDAALQALLPLPYDGKEDRVMSCSLSGFVFLALFALGGGGGFGRRQLRQDQEGDLSILSDISFFLLILEGIALVVPEVRELLDGRDGILDALELGNPQECRICGTESGCDIKVDVPAQNNAAAYIWQLEQCGDFIFAGSLDLGGVIGRALGPLIPELGEQFGNFSLPDGPIAQEIYAGLAATFFFDAKFPKITFEDFGFELWQMSVLEVDEKDPAFEVITTNGFRGEGSAFDFTTIGGPLDDGVRALNCVSPKCGFNEKLFVGTAVYGPDQASSTFSLNADAEVECDELGLVIL